MMESNVPAEISNDIGDLLERLRGLGFRPIASRYDSEDFGNYVVEFDGPIRFSILRDRSEYSVTGPSSATLNAAGLNGVSLDLTHAVLRWLSQL